MIQIYKNSSFINDCYKYLSLNRMDPTKPILDLYSDYNHQNSQKASRSVRSPPNTTKYSRVPAQKQVSYSELKEKYQELYQAYSEKVQKVNTYEEQLESTRNQNQELRQQIRRLQDKNQQLNASLLNKNVELEEAYRQLQEDIRRGGRSRKNDEALDRLEEGLREAVTSNFNLLREAALSQLKQY